MPDTRDPQLLKGVLPLLVLRLLTTAESYGYELVTRLREAGLAQITTGTVYPVLGRLERDGLLASRLVASSSGPARKYYRPTDDGAAHLARAEAGWAELAAVVTRVTSGPPEPTSGAIDRIGAGTEDRRV
ncbi:PadR family transcriptional regulator [Actinotalea ferrariae CF5-4]|uniref:PadR family transcriptional regulator n=1 Tax=Actinotalea ferrariae CF5-4 TaxID=948458 RepID=A0A021VXF6_9CELL|nr:PadR family transcriptional regulator [Actinotalea ferrariae]EYR64715.1 PadR family transcriptional regulator [Actinotalea ferrariae CF5-4]